MEELELPNVPQVLSPCNSRRRSNASNSPEFEFWMLKNPLFPQPDLHSADELFSGGVLLPLHQLHHHPNDQNNPSPPPPTPQEQETEPPPASTGDGSTRPVSDSGSRPVPELSALLSNLSASAFTSSKRWKDIFKKNDGKCSSHGNNDVNDSNNNNNSKEKVKEKVKKKERRSVAFGGGGSNAAELNINIWPFRRSRSAGNGGGRPRGGSTAWTSRKVSSAPCSRSNSAGESKSTKWPKSPSRNGVHLGRSSPIWQLRRPTTTTSAAGGDRNSEFVGKSGEKGSRKDGNLTRGGKLPASGIGGAAAGGGQKVKVLKLSVPMCIGYRSNLSCKSDENSGGSVALAGDGGLIIGGGGESGGCESDGGASMEGVRSGNLFNIRSLFTKKVY